jgi:1-acyl-sn-glycerol-3-phosphate acyltransferase
MTEPLAGQAASAAARDVADFCQRCWRLPAIALGFVLFGVGAMGLRFIAFPCLRLVVGDAGLRQRGARRMVSASFAAFVQYLQWIGLIRLEWRGAERLRREGLLVLANHPSLIDVVLLVARITNADCIVKGGLLSNPFTRGPVVMAGFLRNSDGPGLVDEAIASVRRGGNLVIFPEGTRTPLQGSGRLQRGAANIAVRGRLDLTPVLIHCSAPFLARKQPWWSLPAQRVSVRIEVGDDIAIAPFVESSANEAIAARHLTQHLSDYFSKEIDRAGA